MTEKEYILDVLKAREHDNLARAWMQFRNAEYETMLREYGSSGKTCFEILGEYIGQLATHKQAIRWLESRED